MKLSNPTVHQRLLRARMLAKAAGYSEIDYQADIGMVSFQRPQKGGVVRHNLYLTKMTIATSLRHPRKGATQIYLRNADWGDVKRLFDNPRHHTGRRYYTNQGG